MRKTILFIAMSLDGYIADSHDGVDWLKGEKEGADDMASYSEFIKEIDTVIMGYTTYYQVSQKLSPERWMYDDLTSYVITHRENASTHNIIFTSEHPSELVRRIRQGNGKDIWICGGADIVQQLIAEDTIDRYYITVIPILLGRGVRLFHSFENEIKLSLVETKSYNGMTDLVYERRK